MKTNPVCKIQIIAVLLLVLTSCGTVDPAPINNAIAAIDTGRQMVANQSTAWSTQLPLLYDQLNTLEKNSTGDTKTVIADTKKQVAALLAQSIDITSTLASDSTAKAGVETRCTTSFIQLAVSDQLQFLADDLKFWKENKLHLNQKPNHIVCHFNPNSIWLYPTADTYKIDSRKSKMATPNIVSVYGYNFRSDAMPSLVVFNDAEEMYQDIGVAGSFGTQYRINFDLTNIEWNDVKPGSKIKVNWPDKDDPNIILLTGLALKR